MSNFKVKCVRSVNTFITLDRIYEVKDGCLIISKSSNLIFGNGRFTDVDRINRFMPDRFELYEEDTILFTKNDFKTGDVVLYRNGEVGIAILELDFILGINGFNILRNCNNDLKNMYNDGFDIVAVRRPKTRRDCCFIAFDRELGILMYDELRDKQQKISVEEAEKMINKELGKNVKIAV